MSPSMFPTTCSGRLFHTGTVLGKSDLSHRRSIASGQMRFFPLVLEACDTALALVVRDELRLTFPVHPVIEGAQDQR